VDYLARVAPRLGMAAVMPAAAHGWQRGGAYASADVGGPTAPVDPADRAFDGGGLVTPWTPTGDRTGFGAGSGT
jgi:D-alanyl-D-alanine carboxypeptidase